MLDTSKQANTSTVTTTTETTTTNNTSTTTQQRQPTSTSHDVNMWLIGAGVAFSDLDPKSFDMQALKNIQKRIGGINHVSRTRVNYTFWFTS